MSDNYLEGCAVLGEAVVQSATVKQSILSNNGVVAGLIAVAGISLVVMGFSTGMIASLIGGDGE